jgi:hypothetical protein
MGLGSSKSEAKEIKVNRAEVLITHDAVVNLNRQFNQEPVKEPIVVVEAKPQEQTLLNLEINQRINDYEDRLVNSFNSASKEVEDLFRTRYKTMPICVDLQNSVVECLNSNTKYPLKCLDVSNQYLKCVESERQNRFNLTAAK